MSQTTRLNREIVDSTRISVPRVKIVVDDSDYVITMYTGIEKILKIEIKKGYDQKTVVSRSENNSETVQSKPSEKSTMDVFVEILASFFKTETVDIGVLEWDFKQHAVPGSENDLKMKKRQGIFVNVLSSKIEKSTGGSTVFHTEKLVISDKCASDFTKGLLNLCDKEYLDSMEVLTLTSIEKASKTGAWCDVYTENAESFYSQGVFYEEVPCVDKFLMTTSYRTTNWSTLRFARLNEKAMKIWSRAGSVLSRTPDKKEFKIVREKAEKKILLHKKTECGYSITVYTDEKFEKLGGMKWFETEFMNQKCDLGWFCKKCSDPFDYWYHQNLPTLNSKVLEINSDDTFVKSWGFKKSEGVGPPTATTTTEKERRPNNERAQLIAQYEQLYLEVSQLAENFTKKISEEIKKLEVLPQKKEIKTGLMKCKELSNGANALVETVQSMLLKLKKSEKFGVDVIRVRIGQILEAKSRLEASMKLFGDVGSKNKLPLQQIEKEILIAQCEQLFPEVSDLSVVVLTKMSEVAKKLEGVPLSAAVKTAMKPWKEWTRAFGGLPKLTSSLLNQFKNSSNQVSVKVIREKLDSIQKLRIRLESAMQSVEEMEGVSKDVIKTPDAGKAKLVAQCSQLFPEVATLLIKLTGIVTQNLKRLKDKKQTKAVKTEIKDCKDLLMSIDGLPGNLLTALKKIKNDEVEVKQIRVMMDQAQSIREKMEAEVKRFEGMGIYGDVGEEVNGNEGNPPDEKSVLIAQCEQLFLETSQMASKLLRIVTKYIKLLEAKPQKTEKWKNGLESCQNIANYCKKIPGCMKDYAYLLKIADVGAEEVRAEMRKTESIKRKLEVRLQQCHDYGYDTVDSEDVKKDSKVTPNGLKIIQTLVFRQLNEEKSALIAQCEQLFPEVSRMASRLIREMTNMIKQIEDLPRKTEELKNTLEACQTISNNCKPVPECMTKELTYLLKNSDTIGVEMIREKLGTAENMKRVLEDKLKNYENGSEDSEDVKKKTSVILNYEKYLLIAECEQLFPEVAHLASTLVSILSKLFEGTEGIKLKTEELRNSKEFCLEVIRVCEPVPQSTMNALTYILENDIGVERIRKELETVQENKLQLEEWLSDFENQKPSDCIDISDALDTVSLDKSKEELIAEYEQLAKEISQIAMNFSTNLFETAEASTRMAKPEELPKGFREDFETGAETYKGYSKKFDFAIGRSKKMEKGKLVKQILQMQKYKVQLEMEVETIAEKLWKKDSEDVSDAPDVKTMAVTDGVSEDAIKTSDDKKDYEAMNPAAGKAELVAQCEKLIPEVVQSVIKFLGFLTKYIERLEDASQTDAVKADLKDCKYVLKPIEGLPAKLLNVLRRIKGDDTFDVEEIRETMVKVHAIRREMETGMKRFEGMDMDVGEQANGKETTDGVSEDVIKTPNDSKDCEAKNPDCEEASEKPDVFQTIGKKMFGSIPEANALVDPRSRKARSINPDDYDYVGSMYPDDFTHYLEHRRKLENRDFDFDCSWARLQFLAVFFFVFFSILFVVLWIETFVY
ncbi:hypothetical protein CRE_28998 [Caenorhabditis remanei]|uniref:Uncharacterized protein n=1 Tax=Caenorhabditis remanei TaxID=31234 RepID=E3N5F1_CAERE|nr:hypothetical protein CRE_28998 [Caenorhabditis remanei]